MTDLAKKHNRTVAQIMLRWAIQSGAAVIPGTGKFYMGRRDIFLVLSCAMRTISHTPIFVCLTNAQFITGNPKYMKENLSIYDFTLSEEEMSEIEKLRHEKDLKFMIMKSENFDK